MEIVELILVISLIRIVFGYTCKARYWFFHDWEHTELRCKNYGGWEADIKKMCKNCGKIKYY